MAKKKHVYRVSASKRREAKRRAFYEAHRKGVMIGCIAAAVAVVIGILAFDYFYTPGGSMRLFLGNLLGAEENAIIREVKDGRYYTLGYMDVPDGYAVEEYESIADEAHAQYRYLVDQTGEKAIHSVYVSGVKNNTGEKMVSTLAAAGYYTVTGEPGKATIGGHEVNYLYTQNAETQEEDSTYFASLIAYVDTVQGCTVLLSCNTPEGMAQEDLPDEAAMLASLEDVLPCLTIPEK